MIKYVSIRTDSLESELSASIDSAFTPVYQICETQKYHAIWTYFLY